MKARNIKPKGNKKSLTKKTAKSEDSRLPAWVIGCYDGPPDRKLSLAEGYPS